MRRRGLLATPLLAAPVLASKGPANAQGAAPRLATEEFLIPSRDAGIQLYLRNKRPEQAASFAPGRTLLFVHGLTFPASAVFDLPLGGQSWMEHIAARGFDVWCVDIRGFGRSSPLPEVAQPAGSNPPVLDAATATADFATASDFIRGRRGLPRISSLAWSWGTVLAAPRRRASRAGRTPGALCPGVDVAAAASRSLGTARGIQERDPRGGAGVLAERGTSSAARAPAAARLVRAVGGRRLRDRPGGRAHEPSGACGCRTGR